MLLLVRAGRRTAHGALSARSPPLMGRPQALAPQEESLPQALAPRRCPYLLTQKAQYPARLQRDDHSPRGELGRFIAPQPQKIYSEYSFEMVDRVRLRHQVEKASHGETAAHERQRPQPRRLTLAVLITNFFYNVASSSTS